MQPGQDCISLAGGQWGYQCLKPLLMVACMCPQCLFSVFMVSEEHGCALSCWGCWEEVAPFTAVVRRSRTMSQKGSHGDRQS